MPYYFFHWNEELIAYIEQHGISPDDFESIVMHPQSMGKSRSTGRDIAFGWTSDDRYIACVFELIDNDTILPITAYEVSI